MGSDYTPIDCGLHSRYELAVMRRQSLLLCWRDADGTTVEHRAVAIDLYTKDGEEFLVAVDAQGHRHTLRLDRILSCDFPADAGT